MTLRSNVEWKISNTLINYDFAISEMQKRIIKIKNNSDNELIWLLEHSSIFTAGTSAKDEDLINNQVETRRTGRGGEWTWHGPGQRVVYVMLNLKKRLPDVKAYVNALEEWIILTLEDFDIQPTIGKSSSINKDSKELEQELQFELKTSIPQSEINEIEASSEEVSPMSLTITELQKRAEERRQKMKGFNYKFTDQMNKNIDEIERQPAYKRLGVNLDESSSIISKSKTTLSTDDNDDIQLKSNNSFLHDNVD